MSRRSERGGERPPRERERGRGRRLLGRLRDAVGRVREDVAAIQERDPAAGGTLDVLLFYPGMTAVWTHRVAHALWRRDHHFAARLLSHSARLLTAVEIHPGAELGRRVTIDHGAGVVVGETADVGDDVHFYHGVTLGANQPHAGKRHPTVESDVVLGAGATLVGAITVGAGASIGASAVVSKDVPPGATMVGNPARRVDEADESDEADGTSADAADERGASTDGPLENGECADEAVSEGHADGGTEPNPDDDAAPEADCGEGEGSGADATHSRHPC